MTTTKTFAGIALAEYVQSKLADGNVELAEEAVYQYMLAQGSPAGLVTRLCAISRLSRVLGASFERRLEVRDVFVHLAA